MRYTQKKLSLIDLADSVYTSWMMVYTRHDERDLNHLWYQALDHYEKRSV
jgi:hypothetical protein